jgi:hypothetical protein
MLWPSVDSLDVEFKLLANIHGIRPTIKLKLVELPFPKSPWPCFSVFQKTGHCTAWTRYHWFAKARTEPGLLKDQTIPTL